MILKNACQLPSDQPIFAEIARFILVHGSIPMSTSTSKDKANPIVMTARITVMSLLAKCSF